jgi:hypothetical protein
MPVKRRRAKARAKWPEAIQLMLAGLPVERTVENARELEIALAESEYFNGDPLPPETINDIRAWLDEWRQASDPRVHP